MRKIRIHEQLNKQSNDFTPPINTISYNNFTRASSTTKYKCTTKQQYLDILIYHYPVLEVVGCKILVGDATEVIEDTCLFSSVIIGDKGGAAKEFDLLFSNFPEEIVVMGTLSTICFCSKSCSRPYNICLTLSNARSKLSSCVNNYKYLL